MPTNADYEEIKKYVPEPKPRFVAQFVQPDLIKALIDAIASFEVGRPYKALKGLIRDLMALRVL